MRPTVILSDTPHSDILELMGDRCDLQDWSQREPTDADLARADGFYTYGHMHIDGPLMDRMPKCRVISNFGVGVDHIDLGAARARGISVGNTPNVLDGATADMTVALMMAAARNLIIGDRYARSQDFTTYDPNLLHGQEVHSATLGIIGMGNIGRQVARRALAFDMKVLYHNRNRNRSAERDLGVSYASLDDLLERADFVTLNVPLTEETRGLIGTRELARMKSTAILVNVARGPVVDHAALLASLQNREIYAAALDVTDPEPLPRDHPLLDLDNVIIAPHLGSATRQTRLEMARLSVENLLAGLAGRPLPSAIT